MQLNAEVRAGPWGELREAMEKGKIDALAMFYSEKRNEILDFSSVFSIVHNAIFIRKDTPAIKTQKDLLGKDIIVIRGDIMHDYILENNISNNPVLVANESDALRLLASGKHDLALMAQLPGLHWAKELKLTNIKTSGPLLRPSETAYAVSKNNILLQQELNEGLAVLKETGVIKKLNGKWFSTLIEPGISKETIIKYIIYIVGIFFLLFLFILIWFRSLKNQVAARTLELQKSEQRFRMLFEHTDVSIWNEDFSEVKNSLNLLKKEGVTDLRKHLSENPELVFTMAGSIKVLHVNEATLKLFNAQSENEFLSGISRTFGTGAMDIFLEELCAIWEKKTNFRSEASYLTFDGKELTCIISFNIPTSTDEFDSIPVSISDITEQKQLENELRASQQQFNLFMLHLPYVVGIKDELNRVIYSNPRAIEYVAESSLGKKASETIGGKEGEEIILLSNKARVEGKAEKIIELELNGQKYVSRVLAFAIPQENKEVYVGMIYIDITQSYKDKQLLKKNEEIMIAQSRHAAMGEMVSMIAHQWRQPITIIAMGANNLLMDIALENISEQSIKQETDSILIQTEYLSKTIDDFRNFFRPDKTLEDVLLNDIIFETQKIIGKSLENENILLLVESEKEYYLRTYSRELLQVFINLVKNAKESIVENREKNRRIDVLISDNDTYVITTVCDNGGGINKEIINDIFNPYFSTKGVKNGTGLGLYMSKTIIEKHLHGTIEAYNSENGACFKVSVPKVYIEKGS